MIARGMRRVLFPSEGAVGTLAPDSEGSEVSAVESGLRGRGAGRRHRREWAIVTAYLACLALAFINSRSVWLDEAIGVSIASQPLGRMLQTLQHVDAVHGLYYSLLHVWLSLGQNAIVIRLPSVAFAVLASIAIGRLAKLMFGEGAAAPAVAILATSTFFLYYADEARPAAFTLMMCSYAALYVWRAIRSRRGRDIAVCGVFFLFAIYANVLAMLFLFATCLVVWTSARSLTLLRLDRKTVAAMAATAVAVCIAAIPLLLAIHEDSLAQIGWIVRSNARQIVYFTASIVGSNEGADRGSRIATELEAIVVLVLLAIGIIGGWRSRPTRASVIAASTWLAVPLAIGIAIDQWVQPILIARYFSFLLIPVALLAGNGLAVLRRGFGPAAAYGTVALLSVVSIYSLATVEREDWRAVTTFLSQRSHAGDGIVFWTPWTVTPFEFAVGEKNVPVAAAIAYPNGPLINAVGYPRPKPAFIRAIGRKFDRLWLVESNAEEGPHPFDALAQRYAHQTRYAFPGITLLRYSRRVR
jgi:mannosyltransferase